MHGGTHERAPMPMEPVCQLLQHTSTAYTQSIRALTWRPQTYLLKKLGLACPACQRVKRAAIGARQE
jgi:hypothetical protein